MHTWHHITVCCNLQYLFLFADLDPDFKCVHIPSRAFEDLQHPAVPSESEGEDMEVEEQWEQPAMNGDQEDSRAPASISIASGYQTSAASDAAVSEADGQEPRSGQQTQNI